MSVAENFRTGLLITGMGMGLVFLTLVLVMLCAMVLDKVFRPKAQDGPAGQQPLASVDGSPSDVMDAQATSAERARREAVAIGVAIALEQEARQDQDLPSEIVTVANLDRGPGIWKSQGRIRSLQ